MRKYFSELILKHMDKNENIHVVTADLGYGLWDNVRDKFPNRFHNVGSSEMAMMGVGIGLAMEGKIPFVYSITPFAIYRPFEMIRNYVNHEKIPVNIIGGGRDRDYGYLGFSHWAEDDIQIMKSFESIKSYKPNNLNELDDILKELISNPSPSYINLKR